MKKRGREINVFSVSALDLFASALGAFILMSMIFMVFFSMTSKNPEGVATSDAADGQVELAELQRCEAQLAATRELLEESEARNEELEARLAQVEAALARCQQLMWPSFVLVMASWPPRHDVDMHMTTPSGRESFFDFENRSTSGARGTEGDNINWVLVRSAEQGRYRVCYKLNSGRSATDVHGSVVAQEAKFKIPLPPIRLAAEGQVRLAADVVVDADGNVTVDRTRSGTVLGTDNCR